MEPVSPELVLVDPALAGRVRPRVPQAKDTLARVDALVQSSRRVALARHSAEVPVRPAPRVVEPKRRIPRTGQRRSAALAGAVAAGALVAALFIGVRIELGGTPAGADTTFTDRAPAPSAPAAPSGGTGTKPAAAPPQRATKPRPQRFAWAPTASASAYHVELFLGSSRVFEADTKRPTLTVPARWRSGGRARSLQPAEYRWYVWPVFSGRRAANAIVQARLVVPAG